MGEERKEYSPGTDFSDARVWTIGRQDSQSRAGSVSGVADACAFAGGQIIDDYDVARVQRRCEILIDIGEESLAMHRAVQHHRRGRAAETLTAAINDALAAKLLPQYRARDGNVASVALAKRVGFVEYGWMATVLIRLPDNAENRTEARDAHPCG